MTEKLAVSVEEAAKAAGVGRTCIFMEMRSGRLKGRKIGRRTVITIDDLNRWLTALPYSKSGGVEQCDADARHSDFCDASRR